MVIKNQIYQMEITDLNNEGNGVGKIDGFVVFVPLAVTGDTIDVKIVKVLKNYAFGIVEKVITPSADRIENECPVYQQCGGCSLRHISYEAELKIKQKQVADCMQRIGGMTLPIEEIVGNGSENHYRNKAQFPVTLKDGKVVAGFYAKRSHRVVECTSCLLQPESFEGIVQIILDFCNEFDIVPYDEQTHTGMLRNIYLRKAEQTGQIMVCLVSTKKRIPFIETLVDRLVAHNANITSIIVNRNNSKTNVILGTKSILVHGTNIITDILKDIKVELSPLSFYQVNNSQAERLYTIAEECADLTGTELLIDLYCGAGTIGLSMADKVEQVVGVEIVPDSIENAERNAIINKIKNADFICADAKTAVEQFEEQGMQPDVVIVDPPRKGCEELVINSICQMAPSRIVMISCNPSTAARDCKLFEQKGYQVTRITPVDMFPRTLHVETCVLLSHKNS